MKTSASWRMFFYVANFGNTVELYLRVQRLVAAGEKVELEADLKTKLYDRTLKDILLLPTFRYV